MDGKLRGRMQQRIRSGGMANRRGWRAPTLSERTGRALLLLCVLTAGHLAPLSNAFAIQLVWDNPSGGNASVPSNWDPSQVPTTADILAYSMDGVSYQVTFDGSLPTTFNHRVREGDVTMRFNAPHTITSLLEIGACCGDSCFVTIPSGQLTVESAIEVGQRGIGALTVTGRNTDLIKAAGSPGFFEVGHDGTGTLHVTGGAAVRVESQDFRIAVVEIPGNDASGKVIVSGVVSVPTEHSRIEVRGTGADVRVGHAGQGELIITSGGIVSTLDDVFLTPPVGLTASVAVGQGTSSTSSLIAGDDVFLSGDATVHVFGFGEVDAADRISVDGPALLHVAAGSVTCQDLDFGTDGGFSFESGVVHVDGGTLDPPGTSLILNSTTGSPTLELLNGATTSLSLTTGNQRALQIGTNGTATMEVLSGSSCTITAGNVSMAVDAGGSGALRLDGGSNFSASNQIFCGSSGAAQIVVEGGSTLTAGSSLMLGLVSSGEGAVDVLGAGSQATVLNLGVGGSMSSGPLGDGFLTLVDGASMQVTNSGTNTRIWETGVVNVASGATFNSTGVVVNRGAVQMDGATFAAATVDFDASGLLLGNGVVNARIQADSPTCAITASGGAMTLGKATDSAGFANQGTLNVGGQTVALLDSDGPLLGNVVMTGGTLDFAEAATLSSGKSLSGSGLVTGDILNSGSILPTGAGLRFDGLVTGVGQSISGTLVNFLDDGGFTGAGTIDGSVDGDAGSIITASGSLTMGNAASSTGVLLDGELHVGANSVFLRDTGGLTLGTLTTLSGGSLVYNGTLALDTGSDRLQGTGRVGVIGLRHKGTVAPGNSAGRLEIAGAFTNLSGGTLEIELGNHDDDDFDVLAVSGATILDGTLHVVALPGFSAEVGDQFRILICDSRNGTFESVVLDGFDPGVEFLVEYNSDSVDLILALDPSAVEEPPIPGRALPESVVLTTLMADRGQVELELGLPVDSDIRVDLFDISGRRVLRLAEGIESAGWLRYALPRGGALSRGIYFARADVRSEIGQTRRTARLVVLQ